MLSFANSDADADDDAVTGVDFDAASNDNDKWLTPLTLMSMLTMWCCVSNLTLSLSRSEEEGGGQFSR